MKKTPDVGIYTELNDTKIATITIYKKGTKKPSRWLLFKLACYGFWTILKCITIEYNEEYEYEKS